MQAEVSMPQPCRGREPWLRGALTRLTHLLSLPPLLCSVVGVVLPPSVTSPVPASPDSEKLKRGISKERIRGPQEIWPAGLGFRVQRICSLHPRPNAALRHRGATSSAGNRMVFCADGGSPSGRDRPERVGAPLGQEEDWLKFRPRGLLRNRFDSVDAQANKSSGWLMRL